MASRRTHHRDDALLLALACGSNAEQAARAVGVSKSTVFRRLADPEFRRRLAALRADMVERASGMLTAAGMEAVKTLLALLQPPVPAPVRLGAARAVLEIGAELRTVVDLEQRLAALEAQLAGTAA
jgi:AcrR family transcriptional regulator